MNLEEFVRVHAVQFFPPGSVGGVAHVLCVPACLYGGE
eukprot:CAMPEP_0117456168 /NCGR_PEP_ID=MMETSP0759-20121206/11739_1 /TAXON_ID=63605 /ORGANISM="Percolomonas cosmopolitus, Strain WS" /LENGTH=37 /DNA_ID= /DNA_START= /DNA_END= /DNA_ORIENTATION=